MSCADAVVARCSRRHWLGAIDRCLARLRGAPAAVSSADASAPTLCAAPSAQRLRRPTAACGLRLGPWELVERIGSGGFGEVYRARHLAIDGKYAAIKLLSGGGGAALIDEAQATSRARHEHTIDVYDCGTVGQWSYLVTELLEGETLRQQLARSGGGLPVRAAITIAAQLGAALATAHARGVVHLDLKPENVFLVRRERRALFAKLIDFGIARRLDDARAPAAPSSRATAGTPGYMAPEQQLPAPLDARADVFGLGVVLYEMLVGQLPCAAAPAPCGDARLGERARAQLRRAGLPPTLVALVARMLAQEVAARPADMDEVVSTLRPALDPLRRAA